MESFLQVRKRELVEKIDSFEDFLSRTKSEIAASPFRGGAFASLNLRLLMQVHVTDLIEAHESYEQQVTIHFAEKKKEA